jgi:hypothetical protein
VILVSLFGFSYCPYLRSGKEHSLIKNERDLQLPIYLFVVFKRWKPKAPLTLERKKHDKEKAEQAMIQIHSTQDPLVQYLFPYGPTG